MAARDKAFAEFDITNLYDATVASLSAMANPWATKSLCIATAVQTGGLAIAAAIQDYDDEDAAATEAKEVEAAEAERDRIVEGVKAEVRKEVAEKDLAADRVTREAAVLEQNAGLAPQYDAAPSETNEAPNEVKSEYANLPVDIPENLRRPTETVLIKEEAELEVTAPSEITLTFTAPAPNDNLSYLVPSREQLDALTESERSKGQLALEIAREIRSFRVDIYNLGEEKARITENLRNPNFTLDKEPFRQRSATIDEEVKSKANLVQGNLDILANVYFDAVIEDWSPGATNSGASSYQEFFGGVGAQAALDRVWKENAYGDGPKMESIFVEDFLAVYFAGRSIAQAVMKSYVTVGIRGAATTGAKEVVKEAVDANLEAQYGFSPRVLAEGAVKGAARKYHYLSDSRFWVDGMADISKLSRGRKGGVVLDEEWLEQVEAQLKSLDPDMKLSIDDDTLDDLGFLGGFRAGDKTLLLRSDATLFEAVHELEHAKYFADIGSDAARYLGDVGSASRELEAWRYVLNYAENYPGRLSVLELEKAQVMFNEEFRKIFGVLPR